MIDWQLLMGGVSGFDIINYTNLDNMIFPSDSNIYNKNPKSSRHCSVYFKKFNIHKQETLVKTFRRIR